MENAYIEIEIWTEKFLGTSRLCNEFMTLLETTDGGRWRPHKWSNCEPVRSIFGADSYSLIQSEWTQSRGGRSSNQMFFRTKKPSCQFWISTWRGRVASLNSVRLEFEARSFSGLDGVERLKGIVLQTIDWSKAVYAAAWHSQQRHLRCAQWTPERRLERADWLMFFGIPYVELFSGQERILAAPCFRAQTILDGVLLQATERPDDPEVTESKETLLTLEQYLGADAFASDDFPDVPCRVPQFDLSETINPDSPKQHISDNPEPVIVRHSETNEPLAAVVLTKY